MISLAALPLLLLGPGQDGSAPRVPSFEALQIVELALDGPNWRPWVHGAQPLSKQSGVPSATVEVVESLERERQLRLLEFRARTAPLLKAAFAMGYAFRTNVQMLSEFMFMDPANPHPPSVPSVFYNNFKPPPSNPAFQVQAASGRSRLIIGAKKEAGPGK